MKKTTVLRSAVLLAVVLLTFNSANAQLWKKVKDEVKNRAERKVVNKAGDATDKAIDKTVDGATGKSQSNDASDNNADNATATTKTKTSANNYKSYDFVPGDKIIFQPDLSTEPDAELPARFKVLGGNAEIQSFQGEKILHLNPNGNVNVAPLMSNDNYLPEQYTLEFDMMFENDDDYFKYVNDFNVEFRTASDDLYNGPPLFQFAIESNSRSIFGDKKATRQDFQGDLKTAVNTGNTWHHIAIYVRKNIGKAYINQYRVAATNTLPVGAQKVNIKADRYGIKIKNFRLAAGGDDKYKKIVTDGKFITHGILFDVNKSTIKPESMGALNEIVKLMKDHSDLKFEINGHTDADGKADANMKLSQERADAVKAKLVDMGIDESRLTTKGFGASKPIDKNDTAEGKANNRRVEFVKL